MSIFNPHNDKALPKIVEKKENPDQKHTIVINEAKFNPDSEVTISTEYGDSKPARPFKEMMDIVDHDPRLQLAQDTYVQMILGTGIQVKAKNHLLEDKINAWFDEINFEERLEDGLYSYIGAGNLFWEIEPKAYSDFVEIPIDTIESVVRDKRGKIKYYVQNVNNKVQKLTPENIIQFKFTNSRREVWGRGLFHSVINTFQDPRTGVTYQAPIFAMKDVEDGLVRIIQNYASPIMMFYFEDAGENFIEKQGDALKKARPGAKILTDKKFDLKVFEVSGESKFDKYIEHIQKNILEPGAQFPMAFFNAEFSSRAASETSDTIMVRKIKRIQKRLATQLQENFVLPYLKKQNKNIKDSDFELAFAFDNKTDFKILDLMVLFRENAIRRSELRKNLIKHSNIEIDMEDMEDLLPITSVTPTDRFGQSQAGQHDPNLPPNEPKPIPQRKPGANIGKDEEDYEDKVELKAKKKKKEDREEKLAEQKLELLKKISMELD